MIQKSVKTFGAHGLFAGMVPFPDEEGKSGSCGPYHWNSTPEQSSLKTGSLILYLVWAEPGSAEADGSCVAVVVESEDKSGFGVTLTEGEEPWVVVELLRWDSCNWRCSELWPCRWTNTKKWLAGYIWLCTRENTESFRNETLPWERSCWFEDSALALNHGWL